MGHIESGLPSIGLPDELDLNDYLATTASAVGVMLVGFAEGLAAAKTYAARDHYEIDPNRELIGLGAANIGAGLCQGMVVGGSLSKTAVNASAGARSQMSAIAAAGATVITLLFLTSLFEDLPEATLGAVVIASLLELVDVESLVKLYRLSTRRLGKIYGVAARPDFIAAMAAMFGVLIFDTLPGLFIGITVSLVLLVYRASHPHVATPGRVPGSDLYTDVDRHPRTRPIRRSPLFASRADCSSPTPRASPRRSAPMPSCLVCAPSSWMPNRSRSSTSARCTCSSTRPGTSAPQAYGCSSPMTSVRCEISCTPPTRLTCCKTCIQLCKRQSPQSYEEHEAECR